MTPFSRLTSFYAAATALDLATFFVLIFVSVLQFCFVRRHGDSARTWVKSARWSLAIFTFMMFVRCADMVIGTIENRFHDRNIEIFETEQEGLAQTTGFLNNIWRLTEALFRVFLLVTFAMLGAGIAIARSSGAAAPSGWTKMASAAWGIGGLTLAVALGVFGLRCYYWAHVFDGQTGLNGRNLRSQHPGSVVDFDKVARVATNMDLALDCIWLSLSLLVLALAVRTRSLSRSAPHTRTASNYFVACAILFVAQPLYKIIICVMFDLQHSAVSGSEATLVTDVFFRVSPYALILLILFVLGRKKTGGVWSMAQPGQTKDDTAGETVYQTPWGYHAAYQPASHQGSAYDAQAQLNDYYAQSDGYSTQGPQCQHGQQQPHYG